MLCRDANGVTRGYHPARIDCVSSRVDITLPDAAFAAPPPAPLHPDRLDEARAEFHRWQERLDVVVRIRPLLEELQRKCPTSFHAELVLGSVAVLKAILKEG